MQNVKFIAKKNKISAILSNVFEGELELGFISVTVSAKTLAAFKEDMFERASVLSTGEVVVAPTLVAAQVAEAPLRETPIRSLGESEGREYFDPTKTFVESLLALPEDFAKFLLGKTPRGVGTICRRYYNVNAPDAIQLGIRSQRTTIKIQPNLNATISKLTKSYRQFLPKAVNYGTFCRVITGLVELILSNTQPVTSNLVSVDWDKVLQKKLNDVDYASIKHLLNYDIGRKEARSNNIQLKAAAAEKSAPQDTEVVDFSDSDFVALMSRQSLSIRRYFFEADDERYTGRITRRFHTDSAPDTYYLSHKGGVIRATGRKSVEYIVSRFLKPVLVDLRDVGSEVDEGTVTTLLTGYVSYLKHRTPHPQKGTPTHSVNWKKYFSGYGVDIFADGVNVGERRDRLTIARVFSSQTKKESIKSEPTIIEETPDPSTDVTSVGFTTPSAIAKMEQLPKGTEYARLNWPWFFDASGSYDLMQLVCRGDKFSIRLNQRSVGGKYKNGAKVGMLPVDCTYESIRSAVSTAYLTSVLGTGIENFPEIEDAFKAYCDAFVVAAATEINLAFLSNKKDVGTIKDKLTPTYINFKGDESVQEIIDTITYPSGRLRVIQVGKSSEGVFWYVRGNKIGMGPSIKPKRIRFSAKPVDQQIDEFIGEMKSLMSLPDDPVLRLELTSLLQTEASRVKSGLV